MKKNSTHTNDIKTKRTAEAIDHNLSFSFKATTNVQVSKRKSTDNDMYMMIAHTPSKYNENGLLHAICKMKKRPTVSLLLQGFFLLRFSSYPLMLNQR